MSEWRIREYRVIAGPFNGTYGEVYIGEHVELGRKRAIKRSHPYVREEVLLEEALKQQSVRSPYVIQIVDFFLEEPRSILMEYCPRGLDEHLTERLRSARNNVPYDEARDLLHKLLQGLNDAHHKDVIHGDIKPANIRFGEDGFPKLGDFGAARRLRQTSPAVRGSTNWMAREVLEGQDATKESDYFSFGILVYLVFSGRHPFYADDPSCLISEDDNIKSDSFSPVPLSSWRPDIPRLVADLAMELLSRDGERRGKAEKELKAALSEAFESEEPVSVTPPVVRPTAEELARVDEVYSDARRLFFRSFLSQEAVRTLERFFEEFQWQRFQGRGVTILADCCSLLAYIYNSEARFEDAVKAATNGMEVEENHVNSLHTRGYAYIQLGNYPKATNDLQRALDLTRDPRKREQITKLLNTLRVREFAQERRPLSVPEEQLLSDFTNLIEHGDVEGALKLLGERGSRMDGDSKDVVLIRALRPLQSPVHWERIRKLARDWQRSEPFLWMAVLYWRSGDVGKAIEVAKEGSGFAGEIGEWRRMGLLFKNTLAYYYAEDGRSEHETDARAFSEEAVAGRPYEADPLDTRGYVKIVYGKTPDEILDGVRDCERARDLGASPEFLTKHKQKAEQRLTELKRKT